MDNANPNPRYRLVIFDMDGTLTEELLDFARIRAEIGLGPEGILEQIARLPPDQHQHAEQILHRHEMAAADVCQLRPGAVELLAQLKQRGIATALLTRNSAACAQHILQRHGLAFDFTATREHLPHKPHPDSILNITRKLVFSPIQTLMVGDYLYDLQAAQAAGVDSALLCAKTPRPAFSLLATYCIVALPDLLPIISGQSPQRMI